MRLSKRMGIICLAIPFMAVGCGKETSIETTERVNEVVGEEYIEKEEESAKSNIVSKKNTFKDMSIRIPKAWEQVEVEGMLLYKINEQDNFSIVSEKVNGETLESYVQKAKGQLGETIDLNNVEINSAVFNGFDARCMNYNYDLEGKIVNIYQVCFIDEDRAYVMTLGSDVSSYELNKSTINNMLETIKFK